MNRNDDKSHIMALEKGIVSLTKTSNRVQQQQFDQASMLKQCINDLSNSMQRLTNEVVFMKNKIKKMENQIVTQNSRMTDLEHQYELDRELNENKENSHPKLSSSSSKSIKKRRKSSKILNRRRKSLKPSDSEKSDDQTKGRDYKKPSRKISSALATWIKHDCGFPQYIANFADNGYDTIEIVKQSML